MCAILNARIQYNGLFFFFSLLARDGAGRETRQEGTENISKMKDDNYDEST